jgi:hypothetical protein
MQAFALRNHESFEAKLSFRASSRRIFASPSIDQYTDQLGHETRRWGRLHFWLGAKKLFQNAAGASAIFVRMPPAFWSSVS